MIVYRAEIWCDGGLCSAGRYRGTPHDDVTQLAGIARNLIGMYLRDGWTWDRDKIYCPRCSAKLAVVPEPTPLPEAEQNSHGGSA